MTPPAHAQTAPEDRIGMSQRLAYGAGAFVNNLLAAASGSMMIVLNLGLGMDPRLVGLLGAIPRLTDALTDPVMGYVSDNTNTRWGRRRPFIFTGIFLAAFLFALLWQLPDGHSEKFYFWWFLIGSILFYIGYTWWVTPWVALGYELTPDYHERTRLMGTQNFIGQLAYVVAPWFLWVMNSRTFLRNATADPDQIGWTDRLARGVAEITVSLGNLFGDPDGQPDQITGAAGLAILVAIATVALGLLPAIFLRERMKSVAASEHQARKGFLQNVREFFSGFGVTLKSRPFLKLCAATFLVFNGFMLISAFASYVIIYYVCRGDQETGAYWVGQAGMWGGISTFAVVAFMTWLATRIGKRHAFMIGIGVSMLGYGLKWVCYNPEMPWLAVVPAPLMAFGLGTLFTLVPSMVADVVDTDELQTHERREGMYGSIFWWTVKLGLSAALAGSGYLLNATGFDVDLDGAQAARTIVLLRIFDAAIPIIASAIAIWAVYTFPITEQRAYEVRQELERRRGKVAEA